MEWTASSGRRFSSLQSWNKDEYIMQSFGGISALCEILSLRCWNALKLRQICVNTDVWIWCEHWEWGVRRVSITFLSFSQGPVDPPNG